MKQHSDTPIVINQQLIINDYSAQKPLAIEQLQAPSADPHLETQAPKDISFEEIRVANRDKILLGKGGAAKVFKINFEGREIALKEFTSRSDYATEKNIHVNFNHPHIITLMGYIESEHPKFCALLLELAQMTLQNYLDNNKDDQRDPRLCKQYGENIAKGIQYLHSHNTVHMDLKPSNILIVNNGNQSIAKLSDFNISAKMFWCDDDGRYAPSRSRDGTMSYMPPETSDLGAFEELRIRLSYDIWALAWILYFLTTKAETKPHYDIVTWVTFFFFLTKKAEIKLYDHPKVPTTASLQLQCCIYGGWNNIPELRPSIEKIVEVVTDPDTQFLPPIKNTSPELRK